MLNRAKSVRQWRKNKMEKIERPLVASTISSPDKFAIAPESGVFETDAFITSTIQAYEPENKVVKEVTIKCAGRCWPNPGGIGVWAFVVFDLDGNMIHQAFGDIGYGEGVTNNVAAYRAVIEVFNWVSASDENYLIEILSDSQLVVNQHNGEWACKKPHLKALMDEIDELWTITDVLGIRWIPLKENGGADALCQLAYKQGLRKYKGSYND
jgi:ribonuclease HI